MAECYKCGILSEKATLYEGVFVSGIVSVCRKCFFKQKIPLIDNKEIDWSDIDKVRTVRERLSRMSGFSEDSKEKVHVKTDKDKELMRIVEKNFEENLMDPSEVPVDLIPNFNWIIMRKRRNLKLSLKDFADRIFVPESVADSIERGILPKDYSSLIKKVESSLDISLFSDKKSSILPTDLASESKVPSGALMSEIKESYILGNESSAEIPKVEFEMDRATEKLISSVKESSMFNDNVDDGLEIDANNLSLDKVEDLFGLPEEAQGVDLGVNGSNALSEDYSSPLSSLSSKSEEGEDESWNRFLKSNNAEDKSEDKPEIESMVKEDDTYSNDLDSRKSSSDDLNNEDVSRFAWGSK